MDTLGIVGLVAGIVSVILAVVAIWQSLYFYSQGKGTETRVEIALSSIKSQVDTLQAINGKTLDRLTKYATTSKEDGSSQAAHALSVALRELPAIFLQFKLPVNDTNKTDTRKQLVYWYICMWYYTATANVNASFSLPHVNEFDENNSYHIFIKSQIDRSFSDFNYITNIINQLTADEINSSSCLNLYNEVKQNLIDYVGDTSQYFSRHSKST